tara:strand:- start:665 stop:1048 length:384 start_codon:yes stop_codon:yes gene_type:complete
MEKKFLNQSKPDPVREYEREERIRKWSEKQRREEEKEPKTKEISQETAEAIVELLLTSTKNLLRISFRIVKFFVIKFITLISKTVSFVVKPLKTKEKFLVLRLISFVLRSVLVLFILFYLSLFLMLV